MSLSHNQPSQNRLAFEKSPYLLQHAHNPVDWYPWGEEAFERAKKEDKPIFLSIGYSTCHWCHVMERESFEDPEVAQLLNDTFVCIKVDREERPDIDNFYMRVCIEMTGSGGWPLTIFMTPDKKPFYAGTYFPKDSRYGRIGLMDLIPRIKELWRTRRQDILQSAEKITTYLQRMEKEVGQGTLGEEHLHKAYEQLAQHFDLQYGGFGRAPKFPTPHTLLFLLRYWKRTKRSSALSMVEKTLQAMRLGGIYDHLGFGFHRYSTDPFWLVPHFEKMLYDQAMLAMAYLEAYQVTRKDLFARTAREIFEYVLRDMTAPCGGFFSAEDADSEGEEGKFYLWTEEEIRQTLDPKEAELVIRVFNVEKEGNFREEATGQKTGRNILHLKKLLPEVAEEVALLPEELENRLEEARRKLCAVRGQRVPPLKDDKILTNWNGLMIAALAKGTQVFGEEQYALSAQKAVDFLLKNLRNPQGRLLHRYREGEASILANVEDYAFLIWGLLELYEATFEADYLQTAFQLNEELLAHFWDEEEGGFWFTPDDGEVLPVRQKEIYDGATPSGNSVAMLNLLRLGRISGDKDLEEKAWQMSRAFAQKVHSMPSAYTQLMIALDFALGPAYEVVIAGRTEDDATRELLQALRKPFLPNKVLLFRPTEISDPPILKIAPFLQDYFDLEDQPTAYVCQNYTCQFPTMEPARALELLGVE